MYDIEILFSDHWLSVDTVDDLDDALVQLPCIAELQRRPNKDSRREWNTKKKGEDVLSLFICYELKKLDRMLGATSPPDCSWWNLLLWEMA